MPDTPSSNQLGILRNAAGDPTGYDANPATAAAGTVLTADGAGGVDYSVNPAIASAAAAQATADAAAAAAAGGLGLIRFPAFSAFSAEAANARNTTISQTSGGGGAATGVRRFQLKAWTTADMTTALATATWTLTAAGRGTVIAGSGTNTMVVTTDNASGCFDATLTDALAETAYVSCIPVVPASENAGFLIGQAASSAVFV